MLWHQYVVMCVRRLAQGGARLCVVALLVLPLQAQAQLERFLTSEPQRLHIDQERHKAKNPVLVASPSSEASYVVRRLSLDALIKTDAGVALWINQRLVDRPMRLLGIEISPALATNKGVRLLTPKGERWLKLGQVYLVDKDKVVERYED